VYHAPLGSETYTVIAECIQGDGGFVIGDLEGCFRVTGITTEGECDLSDPVCRGVVPPPVPETPELLLSTDSIVDDIVVEWTVSELPDDFEVWRSIDGGSFIFIGETTTTIFHDTDSIGAGEVWCYKVRGKTAGITGDFSNEGCAVKDKIYLGTGAVSYPTWQIAFGDLQSDDITLVTSADFSGLRCVKAAAIGTGSLFFDAGFILTSVNLDNLIFVERDLHFSVCSIITDIGLPKLERLGNISGSNHGNLFADQCTALTNFSFPVFIMRDWNFAFDQDNLSATSVEHILARGVASPITSAQIFLDNGTNAGLSSLSAQGQADYATLVGEGNTVSTNP